MTLEKSLPVRERELKFQCAKNQNVTVRRSLCGSVN